ncbi:tyrosine-type recombinase/integrase [Pseudanabaena sp. PCC 6802]|uniref:tyrosine-type recombinase/integrase n=1 Tax=Pseudanabaena sp. PCC 6802 TaxID=118173 RepID=UPI00034919DA|nr:tyrosine-type recombinase/integrase [Pseudanabaena sp. PCC 6802]
MKVTIENHNGRLRLRWLYQGKRYTLSAAVSDNPTGRALARQKAAQIELDISAGYFDPSLLKYKPKLLGKNATELTAPQLFDRYVEAIARDKNLTNGSLRRYQGIQAHVRQHLTLPAVTVSDRIAGDFAAYLKEHVSDRTAKEYLWMLRSCWDWARGKYHIADENPWIAPLARIKPQPKQKVRPFTTAEIKAILAAFEGDRYYSHYYPFVQFLFGTGCRLGEAIALQWKHLGADYQTAWIGQSIADGKRKSTKTGKARTILLSSKVSEMLRSRHEALQPKPDDLVFPSPKGGYIDSHNFRNRAWKHILEQCHIEYRKPYSTRHTAISHALANGANYLQVAEATGHDPRVLHQSYASAIEQQSVFVEF